MAAKKKKATMRSKTTSKATSAHAVWNQWGFTALLCCFCAVGGYLVGSHAWARRQALIAADTMRKIAGVHVEAMGDRVVLTGEAATMEDFNKARAAARSLNAGCTNAHAMNLVTLSEDGKAAFLAQLRSTLQNRRVRARFLGNRLILEGMVRNEFDADKAVELTKAALGAGEITVSRETAAATEAEAPSAGDTFQILDMLRIRGR